MGRSHLLKKMPRLLLTVITALFIGELILGYNGKLLLVGEIPVRVLTYALFLAALCGMLVHAAATKKLTWVHGDGESSVWRMLNPFDLVLALFLLFNAIWVFIIPAFSGYDVEMALQQVKSTTLLLLYFPLLILMRIGYIRLYRAEPLIKFCLAGLALLHIFLYTGEKIYGDATFAIHFFETLRSLTLGHSERPPVMYPMNYFKIIYPTSLYLLMIFYFTHKSKLTPRTCIFYLLGLTALFLTLTKSLWMGLLFGFLFLFLFYFRNRMKGRIHYKKLVVCLSLAVVSGYILNATLLDNYLFTRILNTFAVNSTSAIKEGDIRIQEGVNEELRFTDELEGTKRANDTRLVQTRALLEQWRESPWIGFGYGSYTTKLLRSSMEQPYLYEMLLPSLLLQIGVVGVAGWAAFFIFIVWFVKNKAAEAAGALYLVVAIIVASQFNPFILGAPSMSMLLYCFLTIRLAAETQDKAKTKSSIPRI
ncbi:hypothetical protein J25TS5_51480 [Paenibacillus faecis]|uniref:O-antigen ligase family protein n=1 Tax=Paenibacillus faecis TaxID=862114 RepID=UPI001B03A2E4|nr:O-antigen ligase family protein [Paenibacillus faecis]GIO88216.1 hypothetical protein J25TS5_51480 [Paenibacillus faecis]